MVVYLPVIKTCKIAWRFFPYFCPFLSPISRPFMTSPAKDVQWVTYALRHEMLGIICYNMLAPKIFYLLHSFHTRRTNIITPLQKIRLLTQKLALNGC